MNDSLTFVRPILGLESQERFTLAAVDGAPGLFSLRSATGLRLFVLDANMHVPGYTPRFTPDQLGTVGGTPGDSDELLTLVVVTPAAEKSTANLAAPILVNPISLAAAQVILEGDEWPLRYSLAA